MMATCRLVERQQAIICHAASAGPPRAYCLEGTSRLIRSALRLAMQSWHLLFACRSIEDCCVTASGGACETTLVLSNGDGKIHNVLELWGCNSNVTSCGMAARRPLRHTHVQTQAFAIAGRTIYGRTCRRPCLRVGCTCCRLTWRVVRASIPSRALRPAVPDDSALSRRS